MPLPIHKSIFTHPNLRVIAFILTQAFLCADISFVWAGSSHLSPQIKIHTQQDDFSLLLKVIEAYKQNPGAYGPGNPVLVTHNGQRRVFEISGNPDNPEFRENIADKAATPGSPDLLAQFARLEEGIKQALETKNLKKAIAQAREMERLFNNNYKTHYWLGSVCYKLGRFEEAIKYFNEAIKKGPNYPGAYFRLGELYTRIISFYDFDKAKDNFLKALELYETSTQDSSEVNKKKSIIYSRLGELVLRQIQERLKAGNPVDEDIIAQQISLADEYFGQAIKLQQTAIVVTHKQAGWLFGVTAERLRAAGNINAAIQAYEKGIFYCREGLGLADNNSRGILLFNLGEAYFGKGQCLSQQGEIDPAAECFTQAKDIWLESAKYAYGNLYEKIENAMKSLPAAEARLIPAPAKRGRQPKVLPEEVAGAVRYLLRTYTGDISYAMIIDEIVSRSSGDEKKRVGEPTIHRYINELKGNQEYRDIDFRRIKTITKRRYRQASRTTARWKDYLTPDDFAVGTVILHENDGEGTVVALTTSTQGERLVEVELGKARKGKKTYILERLIASGRVLVSGGTAAQRMDNKCEQLWNKITNGSNGRNIDALNYLNTSQSIPRDIAAKIRAIIDKNVETELLGILRHGNTPPETKEIALRLLLLRHKNQIVRHLRNNLKPSQEHFDYLYYHLLDTMRDRFAHFDPTRGVAFEGYFGRALKEADRELLKLIYGDRYERNHVEKYPKLVEEALNAVFSSGVMVLLARGVTREDIRAFIQGDEDKLSREKLSTINEFANTGLNNAVAMEERASDRILALNNLLHGPAAELLVYDGKTPIASCVTEWMAGNYTAPISEVNYEALLAYLERQIKASRPKEEKPISKEAIADYLNNRDNLFIKSLDAEIEVDAAGETVLLKDMIPDRDADISRQVLDGMMTAKLKDKLLQLLRRCERRIEPVSKATRNWLEAIKLYYVYEMPLIELGRRYSVTESRMSQLVTQWNKTTVTLELNFNNKQIKKQVNLETLLTALVESKVDVEAMFNEYEKKYSPQKKRARQPGAKTLLNRISKLGIKEYIDMVSWLADYYGVSGATIRKWLKPIDEDIIGLGVKKHQRGHQNKKAAVNNRGGASRRPGGIRKHSDIYDQAERLQTLGYGVHEHFPKTPGKEPGVMWLHEREEGIEDYAARIKTAIGNFDSPDFETRENAHNYIKDLIAQGKATDELKKVVPDLARYAAYSKNSGRSAAYLLSIMAGKAIAVEELAKAIPVLSESFLSEQCDQDRGIGLAWVFEAMAANKIWHAELAKAIPALIQASAKFASHAMGVLENFARNGIGEEQFRAGVLFFVDHGIRHNDVIELYGVLAENNLAIDVLDRTIPDININLAEGSLRPPIYGLDTLSKYLEYGAVEKDKLKGAIPGMIVALGEHYEFVRPHARTMLFLFKQKGIGAEEIDFLLNFREESEFYQNHYCSDSRKPDHQHILMNFLYRYRERLSQGVIALIKENGLVGILNERGMVNPAYQQLVAPDEISMFIKCYQDFIMHNPAEHDLPEFPAHIAAYIQQGAFSDALKKEFDFVNNTNIARAIQAYALTGVDKAMELIMAFKAANLHRDIEGLKRLFLAPLNSPALPYLIFEPEEMEGILSSMESAPAKTAILLKAIAAIKESIASGKVTFAQILENPQTRDRLKQEIMRTIIQPIKRGEERAFIRGLPRVKSHIRIMRKIEDEKAKNLTEILEVIADILKDEERGASVTLHAPRREEGGILYRDELDVSMGISFSVEAQAAVIEGLIELGLMHDEFNYSMTVEGELPEEARFIGAALLAAGNTPIRNWDKHYLPMHSDEYDLTGSKTGIGRQGRTSITDFAQAAVKAETGTQNDLLQVRFKAFQALSAILQAARQWTETEQLLYQIWEKNFSAKVQNYYSQAGFAGIGNIMLFNGMTNPALKQATGYTFTNLEPGEKMPLYKALENEEFKEKVWPRIKELLERMERVRNREIMVFKNGEENVREPLANAMQELLADTTELVYLLLDKSADTITNPAATETLAPASVDKDAFLSIEQAI